MIKTIKFKSSFQTNTFILNEETVKKIKYNIQGGINNYNIEDFFKSIKATNTEINIDIYPLKTEYKNKNNNIEKREQNIIIIGTNNMFNYLSKENEKQYGLDCTYHIIPRSLKPYKLMTICDINPNNETFYLSK